MAYCGHTHFENIQTKSDSKTSFMFNYEVGTGVCVDCKKEFRIYRRIGKLFGSTSNWIIINFKCVHTVWEVDETTIRDSIENVFGSIGRSMENSILDGAQNHLFLLADVRCCFCGETLHVRSDCKRYMKLGKEIHEPIEWKVVN